MRMRMLVSLGGESVTCDAAKALDVADEMHKRHGGVPSIVPVPDAPDAPDAPAAPPVAPAPAAVAAVAPPAPVVAMSTWKEQVMDGAAKARIEAAHKALKASGVDVDASQQLYATGTRLADGGYARQASRKVEHDAKVSIPDAADALRATVEAEGREDREVTAREFSDAIQVNGKIRAFGLALSEQAIRGLLSRIESPALSYVLGIRARLVEEAAKPEEKRNLAAMREDKAKLADVLAHECRRNPDVALKLRTRTKVGDVFAVVSPTYAPADAPAVLADIVRGMPRDAKATWAYDPESTAWEIRASVWTPTPVAEQAVGEPFEGYASIQSRDNGTGRFNGGGGALMLRCLNASTYTAETSSVSRVHRGRQVRHDIGAMLRGAVKAIDALCQAWGVNRTHEVSLPERITIEQAIPGFWRALLTDRRSELAGVLPGRSEAHVQGLTRAYWGERRDAAKLVRADFAQGWTKYIQDQPSDTRREAEGAIGDWLARPRPMACDLAR